MPNKYELITLPESEWFENTEMMRVKRLSDGELGGRVQFIDNLSQSGECWLHYDAVALGSSKVIDKAQMVKGVIRHHAILSGASYVEGESIDIGGRAIVSNTRITGKAIIAGMSIIEKSTIDGDVKIGHYGFRDAAPTVTNSSISGETSLNEGCDVRNSQIENISLFGGDQVKNNVVTRCKDPRIMAEKAKINHLMTLAAKKRDEADDVVGDGEEVVPVDDEEADIVAVVSTISSESEAARELLGGIAPSISCDGHDDYNDGFNAEGFY